MGFFRVLADLFLGKEKYVKIVSPPKNRHGYARGWSNLHQRRGSIATYSRDEITDSVDGKKVKFWLWVYEADDANGDEYVPRFYRKKRRSKSNIKTKHSSGV